MADPDFLKADLIPTSMVYRCPVCNHQPDEPIELVEDEFGFLSVPIEERFISCPECDALIDIGWGGLPWMDGGVA